MPASKWRVLTGPPMTKEQSMIFHKIFLQVQDKQLGRMEGILQMAKLADEWGMPIDEDEIRSYEDPKDDTGSDIQV